VLSSCPPAVCFRPYFPSASLSQIDVTGVPPGKYLLRIELNVLRKFVETTVENNVGIVEVIID